MYVVTAKRHCKSLMARRRRILGQKLLRCRQRSTAAHKARSKAGIREVTVETVLGGSGNGVRRLQQSETATVPWLAAPKFWAMTYFDVAQKSTVAHKARNIAGIREVAVKTVLGGSDSEVCRYSKLRLRQSHGAPPPNVGP